MTREQKVATLDWARCGALEMVSVYQQKARSEKDQKDCLTAAANFATIMIAMQGDL